MIHIEGVEIYQGSSLVLQDVNCRVDQGEFVFLIGKTGSGKSSLLKTLYGELSCKVGNVHVAGFDVTMLAPQQLPLLRRKLGIIFQDFQLLMDRVVEENLSFVLYATGWKQKKEIKKRVDEVLAKVGLDWAGKVMPYQLSGGEQQRIAVARALLNYPVILLADEPTGNVDPEVAHGILNLFVDINKAGTTVLVATHNYDLLKQHQCRVLACKYGYLRDAAIEKELVV